jgi:hypothetical protein
LNIDISDFSIRLKKAFNPISIPDDLVGFGDRSRIQLMIICSEVGVRKRWIKLRPNLIAELGFGFLG